MAAIIGMRGREREGGVSNRLKEARPVSVYGHRYCINVVVQVQGHGMMGGGQNTRNWESYD